MGAWIRLRGDMGERLAGRTSGLRVLATFRSGDLAFMNGPGRVAELESG